LKISTDIFGLKTSAFAENTHTIVFERFKSLIKTKLFQHVVSKD